MTKEQILKKHNHKIWESNDGKWNTYVDDIGYKRGMKRIQRNSEKDLIDALNEHYFNSKYKPNISEVFTMWIDERIKFDEISPQSISRYKNDFRRFFHPNDIIYKKPLCKVTEYELGIFIKKTIRDNNLTAKSYSGLRTIVRGLFGYAKSNGYTNISITTFFNDLALPKKIFATSRKKDSEEIFSEDEIKLVTSYLKESGKIRNLGLLLQFQTGVRVGELSTMKFTDIDFSKHTIHIQRTEIEYDDEKGNHIKEVQDWTKTDAGNRHIFIGNNAIETINMIKELNPNGEYLFMDHGKRIKSQSFHRQITRVCDELNIPRRSTHKIRKTYGTTLFNNNVDESLITKQMGHSDISTTRKYYYFLNRTDENSLNQIMSAINF